MILDSAGNAVASLEDDATARATMHAMVAVEPDAAEELVLLAYDDAGMPVGEARTYFDVQPAVEVVHSTLVMSLRSLTQVCRQRVPREENTRFVGRALTAWSPRVTERH